MLLVQQFCLEFHFRLLPHIDSGQFDLAGIKIIITYPSANMIQAVTNLVWPVNLKRSKCSYTNYMILVSANPSGIPFRLLLHIKLCQLYLGRSKIIHNLTVLHESRNKSSLTVNWQPFNCLYSKVLIFEFHDTDFKQFAAIRPGCFRIINLVYCDLARASNPHFPVLHYPGYIKLSGLSTWQPFNWLIFNFNDTDSAILAAYHFRLLPHHKYWSIVT